MTEIHVNPGRTGLAGDDRVVPFQVEGLDVRGRAVSLGPLTDAILSRSGSQGRSSGASRETRPAPTRTATPPRSEVAWRRLSASFPTKKGRFLPLRPISW